MNKILSILAIWLCSVAAFAQLNTGDDWNVPNNPGLVTKTITVSSANDAYGMATVTTATAYGTGVYPIGKTVSLVATASTGYHFVNWTVGEDVLSTAASYDYVMPDKDVTVTANFAPNKYTVSFVSDGTTVQSESLDFGSAITVPATDPTKEGYTFRSWSPAVAATVPAEDVTYTAVYDINSYDVVFTVEGVEYSKTTQEFGSAITAPASPVKTGYTFGGWTTDATVPAHNVSYDGTYTINQYNVTFNADNGTENTVYTQDFGSAITAPADPVKTGYTFAGWNPEVAATVPANDVTYTANWKVNAYKAIFDVDGVTTESSVNYGAAIPVPADPAKEGYNFAGWTPAVAASMPAEDVTYTATWSLAKYNVTFISDGNTVSSSSMEYGSAITAPADPTKEGYTFLGWNPAVDATVPAHDVTYTASFGKGAFLVTFMVDGQVYSTTSLDFGETVVLPENNPTKTGYTFAGWEGYTDGATVPAKDVVYNALWTVNNYKVTFDVDGVLNEQSLAFGSEIIAPEDPVKEGYTFNGWTPAVATVVPANDVTYTATWKVNSYTLTLMADDKVFYTIDVEYGAAISIPDSNPEKEGYTFDCWDGKPADMIMPAKDLVLPAKWIAKKYKVTFISEKDTISSDSLAFGTAIVAPENVSKTGYSFDGWTPAVAETVPANDLTYYATFKINQYTVTFISDEVEVKSETLDYGSTIVVPTAPEKAGYEFAGWSPAVAETVPAENVTYTATWSTLQYTVTFMVDGVEVQSQTLEYGSPIVAPAAPTKEGYEFAGWTPAVAETVPAENVTYTATWSIPVGINGVSGADNKNEYYTLQGVKVEKPVKSGIYIVNGVKRIIK